MRTILQVLEWLTRESGLRFLARRRASTVMAAATMALALGGNTLAFAMEKAFLASFGLPEADRLLVVTPVRELPGRGAVAFAEAYPNYRLLRETQRSFADIAVMRQSTASLDAADDLRPLRVAHVSASFFPTTKVRPVLGRPFAVEEEGPNAARVAIVSNTLWRTALGGDPNVVGRTVRVDGATHTVVGVMPPGFQHPLRTDLWVPFDLPSTAAWTSITGARSLTVYGRLRDGVASGAARSEMVEFTQRSLENSPDNREFRYELQQIRDFLVPNAGRVLDFVQLGAGLLALLAVANLAALLIAWGFDRRQEMAVRLALGAGRRRVALLLVTQSALVVTIGGIVGVVLTRLALPLLRAVEVAPPLRYFLDELRMDAPVLAVAAVVIGATGIAAGVLPALLGRRTDMADALRASGRTSTLSGAALRWQKAMVVTQASLSVIIVAAAALVGASLRNLARVPVGFRPDAVVVGRIQLGSERYPDQAARAQFGSRLLDNLARQPELEAVGFSSTLPVGDPGSGGRFALDPADLSGEPMLLHIRRISDRYPEVMGIPLLSGRLFDERDRMGGVVVALISRALAERLWPGEHAEGRRLYRFRAGGAPEPIEIVGVLGDVQDGGLTAPAGETVYVHWPQISVAAMSIVVRSRAGEHAAFAALRRAVTASDGVMATHDLAALSSLVDQVQALPRLQTVLLGGFALTAIALLFLGSYGVMMQLVASREREFALRMAFGASPLRVAASVLRDIAMLAVLGAVLGTAGVLLLSAVLEPLVFGVGPRSPGLLGAAATGVLLLGLLAGLHPALRAMRVDVRHGILA